jgi:U3 small nucleolar RNA-associated protein 22
MNSSSHTQKKRRSVGPLPTKDEQIALQNTDVILRTNIFKLQIDELLSTVEGAINSKHILRLNKWVEDVSRVLKTNSTLSGNEITEAWARDQCIRGFILDGPNHESTKIIYKPATSCSVIGSLPLSTAIAPFLALDVAVTMPSDIFDSAKDILNYSYFDKRKLYLAAMSYELAASGLCDTVNVSNFRLDHRKPFLVVKPPFKTKYLIRFFPVIAPTVFKPVSLKMSKNNLRPHSWMSELRRRRLGRLDGDLQTAQIEEQLNPSLLPPTPRYNMAVLEDSVTVIQFKILQRASDSCACFRDVCVLLKVCSLTLLIIHYTCTHRCS